MSSETGGTVRPRRLGDSTARGFAWLLTETVGITGIIAGGQIALAWFLLRDDFGLVALAHTVSALTTLIRSLGLTDLLVQRQEKFSKWSSSVLWLSITSGVVGGGATAAMAPMAARVYGSPQVVGLILVLAAATPFKSASVVPAAWMQVKLRFRFLAVLSMTTTLGRVGLSVVFAWSGFGAYSFVWPELIMAAFGAVVLWSAARPPVSAKPHVRHWPSLLADGTKLFGVSTALTVIRQGDYFALGIWHSASVVGIYFFAFRLSLQVLTLFTSSLSRVLFPVLSAIQDDRPRQTRAFLRATRLLAMVTVPASLLQVALADPVVHAFFDEQWYPAIPVLQVLSASMVLRAVNGPAMMMLKAQGRFGTLVITYAASAATFVALVTVAAAFGGPLEVAWAVTGWSLLPGPLLAYLAIRPSGGRPRDVARIYTPPVAAGTAAVGTAASAGALIPDLGGAGDWIRIVAVALTTAAIYPFVMRRLAPGEWRELTERLRRFAPQKRSAGGRLA